MGKAKNFPESIWKYIIKKSLDDCWEWISYKDKDGYGIIEISSKSYKAHRVAYYLEHNSIPNGFLVCHSCDNPSCCNPNHLWLGTNQDNLKDRDFKERHFKKLTYDQIKKIRFLYSTGKYLQRELGEMYGVSRVCITNLLNYKRWNRDERKND